LSTATVAAKQMTADAEALKDILIETVANNHSNLPNDLAEKDTENLMIVN